jgi:hypothetical protein
MSDATLSQHRKKNYAAIEWNVSGPSRKLQYPGLDFFLFIDRRYPYENLLHNQ